MHSITLSRRWVNPIIRAFFIIVMALIGIIGTIGRVFFVGTVDPTQAPCDDVPLNVYYACDAALRALYEALNTDFLDQVQEHDYTDATIPDEYRDSASSAVVAYAGGGEVEPEDIVKRRLFWEWWLQDALPIAWSRSYR